MPGFDDIIGQQLPVRILQTLLHRRTLPHALLFTGIAGIGKRMAAEIVAMALNCQGKIPSPPRSDACGRCRSCRQIRSGNHPDIIRIEPRGSFIRVDQVRHLLGILAMKPFSAAHRVAIIAESQTMNPESANALLKALEEPPADTTLILTARQTSDLLATIVSRCRHIPFNRLKKDDIAVRLGAERDLDASTAETVAALAEGSFARAEGLIDGRWSGSLGWMIRAAGLDRPDSPDRPTASAALAFAGRLAAEKENAGELLELLRVWVRDLAIWPYQPDLVVHQDRRQQLQRVRETLDDHRLLTIWAAVEKARKDIAANGNLKLTLEIMALRMIHRADACKSGIPLCEK